MNPITTQKIEIDQCRDASGLIVVIDVIRAFTTAAFAFWQGAEKIILVETIHEAWLQGQKHPEYLLIGEENGLPIKGFHFENSPFEISQANLSGKIIVLRTTCGTRGVAACLNAGLLLASSFVVAKATVQRILSLRRESITFVITEGRKEGRKELKMLP